MQEYDIAIIGGGLVGASLARALAETNLSVALIDQQPASALYNPSLDNRGLAISYSSAQFLKKIHVWQNINQTSNVIKNIHVSEHGCFGFTLLRAASVGLEALGYVISASSLGANIVQGLDKLDNISEFRPDCIKALCFDNITQSWTIALTEHKIQAKLIVAADGSNSFLRARQNIGAVTKDYQQTAIVTNLTIASSTVDTAYERFTDYGVLALLPFGIGKIKCIWTVKNSDLAQFQSLSDIDFIAKVHQYFGYRLGKFINLEPRKEFPLQQVRAEQLYGNACVLIGNAANTLHPVAAQGFNLGLRDVQVLADIIQNSSEIKAPINSQQVLQQYAQLRQKDHQITHQSIDSLVATFASENKLRMLSRRVGLFATQFVPFLQQEVIARGLGKCS